MSSEFFGFGSMGFAAEHWRWALDEGRLMVERDRREACHDKLAEKIAEAGYAAVSPYLRFGEPPADSRSTTYYNEESEIGISVFLGRMTLDGHYVVRLSNQLHMNLLWFLSEDREAYFVRGPLGGTGSSGEPLLGTVRSIEPVPDETIIASTPASGALEIFNVRRGGAWLEERVPGLEED